MGRTLGHSQYLDFIPLAQVFQTAGLGSLQRVLWVLPRERTMEVCL